MSVFGRMEASGLALVPVRLLSVSLKVLPGIQEARIASRKASLSQDLGRNVTSGRAGPT